MTINYDDQVGHGSKPGVLVQGKAGIGVHDMIKLDLVLAFHTERVVARVFVGGTHEKCAIFTLRQALLRLTAADIAVKPAG